MPKVGEITRGGRETLDMPGLPWLQEALRSGLTKRRNIPDRGLAGYRKNDPRRANPR